MRARTSSTRRPATATPPTGQQLLAGLLGCLLMVPASDTAFAQETNGPAGKATSPRLSTIGGVAQIVIRGAQKRAVRIRADLGALAARGLSLQDVAAAVGKEAGLADGRAETTAAFLRPLVVAWRNGAPIKLQDIAELEDLENDEVRGGAR